MRKIYFILVAIIATLLVTGCEISFFEPKTDSKIEEVERGYETKEVIKIEKSLEQKIEDLEGQLKDSKEEVEIIKEQLHDREDAKEIQSLIPLPPKQDNELILIKYKLDVDTTEEWMEIISNAIYNHPETTCRGIIENRTTKDHSYYLFIDSLANLETKYGKYRDSIEYIYNNLYSINNLAQILKDKCEAVGYNI